MGLKPRPFRGTQKAIFLKPCWPESLNLSVLGVGLRKQEVVGYSPNVQLLLSYRTSVRLISVAPSWGRPVITFLLQ